MTAPLQPLTDRQREVLDAIRFLTEDIGYPPTVREIGFYMGFSSPTNGTECHLRVLEAKGYILRDEKVARSIRLTGTEKRHCPHCGKEIE